MGHLGLEYISVAEKWLHVGKYYVVNMISVRRRNCIRTCIRFN
jgi:hypothetical protein